ARRAAPLWRRLAGSPDRHALARRDGRGARPSRRGRVSAAGRSSFLLGLGRRLASLTRALLRDLARLVLQIIPLVEVLVADALALDVLLPALLHRLRLLLLGLILVLVLIHVLVLVIGHVSSLPWVWLHRLQRPCPGDLRRSGRRLWRRRSRAHLCVAGEAAKAFRIVGRVRRKLKGLCHRRHDLVL